MEHVCLIPARITSPVEGYQRAAAAGAGVMTRDEMGRPGGASTLEEHAELDALIARHARVRRDALCIAVLEVAHDVGLEVLLEIPDVVREVEHRGDAPGVIHCVDGAAAAIPDGLPAAPPHGKGDPKGATPAGSNAGGSNAGVHSTRHRHGDHR